MGTSTPEPIPVAVLQRFADVAEAIDTAFTTVEVVHMGIRVRMRNGPRQLVQYFSWIYLSQFNHDTDRIPFIFSLMLEELNKGTPHDRLSSLYV